MRVYVISDAHAAGPRDPAQQALLRWLDAVEADRLVLLGDIFHHWWGFRGRVMRPYASLCEALRRVRRRGVALTMVPGNHDFATGPFFKEELGAEVVGPHVAVWDGVRFFLAHGDEADRRLGYRVTRRLLRGRGFAAAMALAGPEGAWWALSRLAGSSRAHGGDPEPLLRAQREWAAKWLADGADFAVMGHLHVPRVVRGDAGWVIHLGDWVEHRTWLCVDGGVATLVQGLDGRTVAGPLRSRAW